MGMRTRPKRDESRSLLAGALAGRLLRRGSALPVVAVTVAALAVLLGVLVGAGAIMGR
jgi:hypothetical protein